MMLTYQNIRGKLIICLNENINKETMESQCFLMAFQTVLVVVSRHVISDLPLLFDMLRRTNVTILIGSYICHYLQHTI